MTLYHWLLLRSSINKAMLNYPHRPFGLAMLDQKFRSVWVAMQREALP